MKMGFTNTKLLTIIDKTYSITSLEIEIKHMIKLRGFNHEKTQVNKRKNGLAFNAPKEGFGDYQGFNNEGLTSLHDKTSTNTIPEQIKAIKKSHEKDQTEVFEDF